MGSGINGRNGESWGQTALYYAYERFKDDYKWGEISIDWLSAWCHYKRPIWCGHRKGDTVVHHEDGRVETVGAISNRRQLRNKVFLPELERLKK
jgi:hypothetical protein